MDVTQRGPRQSPEPQAGSPPSADAERRSELAAERYWRDNLRLVGCCLAIWFAVSFGCGILWEDWLDQFHIAGFPVGFWFAQQGSIYVFVALIFFYARRMATLDKRYGVAED